MRPGAIPRDGGAHGGTDVPAQGWGTPLSAEHVLRTLANGWILRIRLSALVDP